MNFGQAIEIMKTGCKVTRKSWTEGFLSGNKSFIFIGKNQGIKTDVRLPIPYNAEPYADCIMHYTRKGQYYANWIPTQDDMLAEDWNIYLMKNEMVFNPIILKKEREFEIPLEKGTCIEMVGTGELVEIGSVKVGMVNITGEAQYTMLFKAKRELPCDDRIYKIIEVGREELFVYDDGISLVTRDCINENRAERILKYLINGKTDC